MTTETTAPAPATSVVDINAEEALLDTTAYQLRQIANYFKKDVFALDTFAMLLAMQWAYRVRNGEKSLSLAKLEHEMTVREITGYFKEDEPDPEATPQDTPEPEFVEENEEYESGN